MRVSDEELLNFMLHWPIDKGRVVSPIEIAEDLRDARAELKRLSEALAEAAEILAEVSGAWKEAPCLTTRSSSAS